MIPFIFLPPYTSFDFRQIVFRTGIFTFFFPLFFPLNLSDFDENLKQTEIFTAVKEIKITNKIISFFQIHYSLFKKKKGKTKTYKRNGKGRSIFKQDRKKKERKKK